MGGWLAGLFFYFLAPVQHAKREKHAEKPPKDLSSPLSSLRFRRRQCMTTFFERPTTPGLRARPLFVSSPPSNLDSPPLPKKKSLFLFASFPILQILIWGPLPPHPPSIMWFEIDLEAACSSTNKYPLPSEIYFFLPRTASESTAGLVWPLLICRLILLGVHWKPT